MSAKRAAPHRNATRRPAHGRSAGRSPVTPRRPVPLDLEALLAAEGESTGDALLARLAAGLVDGLAAVKTALHAEMMVTELVGTMIRTDRRMLAANDHAAAASTGLDAPSAMTLGLVSAAEELGTPGALGLLRAMGSALRGDPAQQPAIEASERLQAAGVIGPRWSQLIGAPTFVRAFRYGDTFGEQDSLTVAFEYAHREHAVNVLIDHQLTGGVKDVWIAVGTRASTLREKTIAEMSTVEIAEFEDLTAADAHAILAAALDHEPCPEQSDQIEDVEDYLPLLRSRVAHLGTLVETRLAD